jgi:hypothetical protein
MKRKIGFILSDTHGGNTLGLLSPGTVVQMEGPEGECYEYELPLNPVQLYLNKIFEWLLDVAKEYAAGDDILFIHNGDLTQGGVHGALIAQSEGLQVAVGVRSLQRVLDALPNCKTIRIIKGTGVHVFNSGDSEMQAGKILQQANPSKDVRVLYHNLLTYNGVMVDVAHHGPGPGSRVWLEGNVARFYLRNLMETELMAGRVPARLVVRSHYHTYIKETISSMINSSEVESTIVITPSLCMLDDYARKVVKSPHIIGLGGTFFETIDGRLTDVKVALKQIDVRTKEVIEDGPELIE